MKRRVALVALGLLTLLVAGCASPDRGEPAAGGALVRDSISSEEPGTNIPITIEGVQAGEMIGVDFRGHVYTGTVSLQFLGPEGDVIWEDRVDSIGPFVVNDVVTATSSISHQLGLAWEAELTTSYDLAWQPGEFEQPFVQPIAAVSGVGFIALAVAAVVYAAVRKLGWQSLGLGALVWLGAYFLEIMLDGTFSELTADLAGSLSPELYALLWYAYVGVATALIEVVAVYLLARYAKLGEPSLKGGTAFGLGFAGGQALVQGMLALAFAAVARAQPDSVPLSIADVYVLNSPLYGIALIVQQAGRMLVHLYAVLLIFYALAADTIQPVVQASGYKAAMGLLFAAALIIGGGQIAMNWVAAIGLALWGALGVFGCIRLRDSYPA